MAPEPEATEPDDAEQTDLVRTINARVDDLTAELEGDIEAGKGAIADIVSDIRSRIDELLEGGQELTEAELDSLEADLDDLSDEITEEVDEGTERATSIIDDVKRRVKELGSKLRGE